MMPDSLKRSRVEKFEKTGLLSEILWEERFKEDRPGYFAANRQWLETATEQEIFDQWLRGQNIVGYSEIIANALDEIRKVVRRA